MANYHRCKVLNRTVEFKALPSGYIAVGCDGRLVGNYPTVQRAMFEAAEHVRMVEHVCTRPTLDDATWGAVEALACGPVDVELAEADETIRICGGLEDYAGLEHPAIQAACQAYHAAVAEALADDPRAARFNVRSPKGRRVLHSQWMGAQFAHRCGAIGVMVGSLTEDEKATISAADDAGRVAAKNEIDAEDAAGANE